VNEAFAAQAPAVLKARDWDDCERRLSVNDSGISPGQPLGVTGVRILAMLPHEMQRRSVRYGLETMCVGGDRGVAGMFERA